MSATDSASARSRSRSRGAIQFEFERGGETTRVKLRQDVDPSDSSSIQQVDRTAREYADKIPEGVPPGSGKLGEDCGDEVPAFLCPNEGCGEVYRPGRTCRRARCPRCWQSWAFQRATERAAQLYSAAKRTDEQVYLQHLTVSFRPSTRFNSKNPRKRARNAVKRLCQEVNVDSGFTIYHPYRIAEEYRGEVRGHESGEGDMTWADVLAKVEDENWPWEAVRDEFLVYAPHFHVLGISEFVQYGSVSDMVEDETGVVIHRIEKTGPNGSTVSLYDLEDLCAAMAYSVSHSALMYNDGQDEWEAAIQPFGKANESAFDNDKAAAKAKMREIAPDVLGVEFPEPRCSNSVEADHGEGEECDHDHDHGDEEARGQVPPAVEVVGSGGASGGSGGAVSEASGDEWAGASGGYSSEAWEASRDHEPAFLRDSSETTRETTPCNTRLVSMSKAGKYVEDDDWMGSLPEDRRETVREAYDEWQELGCPEPGDGAAERKPPTPVD